MSNPSAPVSHLSDRVVLITGAGSGFGRATAVQAGARGAAVIAADIDLDAAEETSATITESGGRAAAVPADVTHKPDLDAAVALAVDRFGGVDVLVNNAGTMPLAFFADHEQALEAWYRCIDVNLKGVLNGIVAVHDRMIEQGRGHVVNVSSIYGNQGTPGSGVYSATKAAVIALSEALRAESLGAIKVTTVRPTGVVGTNLGTSVVNFDAIFGLTGDRSGSYAQHLGQWVGGTLPSGATDPDDVRYWAIGPEDLARQIVAVIDMPWGVTISDVTVRATGEDFVR